MNADSQVEMAMMISQPAPAPEKPVEEEQSAEDVLAELDALIASAGPDADPELVATADALRMSLSCDDEDNGAHLERLAAAGYFAVHDAGVHKWMLLVNEPTEAYFEPRQEEREQAPKSTRRSKVKVR